LQAGGGRGLGRRGRGRPRKEGDVSPYTSAIIPDYNSYEKGCKLRRTFVIPTINIRSSRSSAVRILKGGHRTTHAT